MIDICELLHGQGYEGPQKWWKLASSDKSKVYKVEATEGKWKCSCPHWVFRLKGKAACKHISVLRSALAYLEGSSTAEDEKRVRDYIRGSGDE